MTEGENLQKQRSVTKWFGRVCCVNSGRVADDTVLVGFVLSHWDLCQHVSLKRLSAFFRINQRVARLKTKNVFFMANIKTQKTCSWVFHPGFEGLGGANDSRLWSLLLQCHAVCLFINRGWKKQSTNNLFLHLSRFFRYQYFEDFSFWQLFTSTYLYTEIWVLSIPHVEKHTFCV